MRGLISSTASETSRRALQDESDIGVNVSGCPPIQRRSTVARHFGSELSRLRRCLNPDVDDPTDECSVTEGGRYNPAAVAAFSLNRLPSLIYRLSTVIDL